MILKKFRLSNKNNSLIAHLNTNSIRNKLEALKCFISKNINILIKAETKIDKNMKRTRLKNRFNKNKTNENWTAFKKQRNFCVKLLCQNKRSYFNRLDPKDVSDSKKFWRTVKPLFSNKIEGSASITLLENDVVESDDTRVAEILNEYFVDITKTLGVACEELRKIV